MGMRTAAAVVLTMGRFARGFAVLALLLWAGACITQWLRWPVPAAMVGMVLLLAVLACRGRWAAALEAASTPLLKHMMLFFIPAVAGVVEQLAVLRAGWLPFVVASVAGAVLTLAVTAFTLQKLLQRQAGTE